LWYFIFCYDKIIKIADIFFACEIRTALPVPELFFEIFLGAFIFMHQKVNIQQKNDKNSKKYKHNGNPF